MRVLTLSSAVLFLLVAIIAFFSNPALGIWCLATSGGCLATWLVYKKQSK
ncbi:hypothetical protein OOZ51_22285 [Arthrobacter sp. MI7-26]|nr:hypothetical protein [Arthrobacter sp. MI7-26]